MVARLKWLRWVSIARVGFVFYDCFTAVLGSKHVRLALNSWPTATTVALLQIPKAFKIIPKLKLWDEVLFLTVPQTWSPQATFYATKLFMANMNEKLVCLGCFGML